MFTKWLKKLHLFGPHLIVKSLVSTHGIDEGDSAIARSHMYKI